MKQLPLFAILLVVMSFAVGCSATPDPGVVAVVVKKPWFFGDGGIRKEVVATGREWFAPSTQKWYVDIKPIQFTMVIDDMFSKDNVPLDFNAAMRVKVLDPVRLTTEFGVQEIQWNEKYTAPAWYSNNVFKPWERSVRRAVKNYGMSEMVSDTTPADGGKSTIERIDEQIEGEMKAEFERIKLPVELIDITIGRANPPDAIKDQRVETARQEQLQKTEVQRQLAEVQRELAERQRAVSDNAYRKEMGLNTEQFVALEAIKMQKEVCLKGGCTFVAGGSGATPVFDIRK